MISRFQIFHTQQDDEDINCGSYLRLYRMLYDEGCDEHELARNKKEISVSCPIEERKDCTVRKRE